MWRSKSRNEIKTDWLDWGETESLVAKWDSQRSASAWRRSHEMIYQRRRTGEEARQEWNAFIQKRIRVPISAHYYYCETRFGICLAKITIRTCLSDRIAWRHKTVETIPRNEGNGAYCAGYWMRQRAICRAVGCTRLKKEKGKKKIKW